MRVCQLKVITSIDHRDRTLPDFAADYDARCLEERGRISQIVRQILPPDAPVMMAVF